MCKKRNIRAMRYLLDVNPKRYKLESSENNYYLVDKKEDEAWHTRDNKTHLGQKPLLTFNKEIGEISSEDA